MGNINELIYGVLNNLSMETIVSVISIAMVLLFSVISIAMVLLFIWVGFVYLAGGMDKALVLLIIFSVLGFVGVLGLVVAILTARLDIDNKEK